MASLLLPSSTSLLHRPSPNPNPKPLLLSFPKPSCIKPKSTPHHHLRASLNPNPKPQPPTPISLAAAAATAAAAVLFLRFPSPSLASTTATSPPPPATVESSDSTLLEEGDDLPAGDVADADSLRSELETKIKSGKFAEAVAVADRLLPLCPNDKDLPLLKAHLQGRSGDAAAARHGFEELLDKNPLHVEAYHGLVMVATQSKGSDSTADEELEQIRARVESAVEMCKKGKKKADLRDFKLLLAQILVMQSDYDRSLKIYQDLAREEPRDFRPHLCQGIIYSIMKKSDEAEKHFEKYRRLVPRGHPYAKLFDKGMMAMQKLGKMEESREQEALKS